MAPSETSSKPTLIQRLFDRRNQAAYCPVVLEAAALVGVAIWLGVTWTKSLTPVWLWCGSMALMTLAAGLWLLMYEAPEGKGLDDVRMMVLSVGGYDRLADRVPRRGPRLCLVERHSGLDAAGRGRADRDQQGTMAGRAARSAADADPARRSGGDVCQLATGPVRRNAATRSCAGFFTATTPS